METKTLKDMFNVNSLITMAIKENKTLIQSIAVACDTINRLNDLDRINQADPAKTYLANDRAEVISIWTEYLDYLADLLPSGSGFDSGTIINLEKSGLDRVVLETSYHHMNEHGYYLRWTEHTITVKPEFNGFDFKIGGRDYRGIKEYMGDAFHAILGTTIAGHDPSLLAALIGGE